MLGPYCILSFMTDTVTIDEKGIPNTIPSDRAWLAWQSEIDASTTIANASHQWEYPEVLPAEVCTAYSPEDASDAQQRNAMCITKTTKKVKQEVTSSYVKCFKKTMKDDRE